MTTAIQPSTNPTIHKPKKVIVPIATALAWGNDPAYIIQEKLDGRFETRQVSGTTGELGDTLLAGEYLRGEFYAFDLLRMNGTDFRPYPLWQRLAYLNGVFAAKPIDCTGGIIHPVPALNYQPSTLNSIWSRGGEGIVRKRLDAPWGTPMEACKRREDFYCVITATSATQSVEIADAATLQPRGKIKLGGGKADQVRVGTVLKVNAFGAHPSGLLREAVLDKDTPTSWLVRF